MEDVELIIDELEDELLRGKKSFLSGKIVIDPLKVTELLAKLRDSVPQSFRDALSILQKREMIIREAESKSDAILRNAQEMQSKMVSEAEILKSAEAEAEKIVAGAEKYRDNMAYSVHDSLERLLHNTSANMQEALTLVEETRMELMKRMEPNH